VVGNKLKLMKGRILGSEWSNNREVSKPEASLVFNGGILRDGYKNNPVYESLDGGHFILTLGVATNWALGYEGWPKACPLY
jgi:hypothetical protein